ncbi:50S ribosomal protein L27 [Candidatus Woesebacteria bacterium RIFCSPLOWO2_01_FULL_39_23]|uniref:Large ribosomal subunit protein bL27 n=1 Tax=Candidatus Woesebacteria bacterium RIFCSPHIGHO2_01_FULL_40_22 TaxID=1802499 RepID=A0A1F7YKU6_9BACT|nr:MAG: 50S ribosomal protein L27 [Candidatus Woesebacteria bacterium RBG_16_40_11]OGM27499.1 MAG: 50S ribosomal protein L27 [Candidatus Woesebacteria bacterium RIFCSPHIGHO2_01_FULL_40_22]OGM36545.1 MAG: 50S ribosomal protein L27 [Candidatus Woesebacteria bacterium RIFCSPHIGHO2_12_FULL_38_9]OGM62673.1 MAG: 50S ribosomal protein L27 [Candidatus Woesebacteria bacterium RIFCSPLOWO2_01_FULL_39_23]
MSKKKQGGKLIQQKRPRPKYLGLKVGDGEKVSVGSILIRQRGTRYLAGVGVKVGRDHTLFSLVDGKVKFSTKLGRKRISVI